MEYILPQLQTLPDRQCNCGLLIHGSARDGLADGR